MAKFITFLLLINSLIFWGLPVDSIGLKVIDNNQYIIHKVEQGETLYRLKVRYKVSVDDIKKSNDNLTTLSIGQEVLIPTKVQNTLSVNEKVQYHVVLPGETLYKIASQYKMSVDNLKELNNLSSNSLTVGQKLKLSTAQTSPPHTPKGIEATKNNKEKIAIDTIGSREKKQLKRKVESGYIKLEENDILNHKYHYCLHKSAPVGSLIFLTCNDNNKTILVKVIGNTSQENYVLIVNKAVFESLGLNKVKFNGSITFLN